MTQGWRRFLPKGAFAKSVAKVAGGTAIAQAFSMLATPVLTRLYRPEDFGLLAVYISCISILSVAASLRFDVAVAVPREDQEAAYLVFAGLGSVALWGSLVGMGLWLGRGHLPVMLGAPGLRPYLWAIPVALLALGGYQVLNYWALRRQAFGRIAQTSMTQGGTQAVCQIGLGTLGVGAPGLMLGDAIGRWGGVSILARGAWKGDRNLFAAVRLSQVWDAVRKYRDYPLLGAPAAVLNNAGLNTPALLFSALFSAQVAGWFSLGHRIIALPMVVLGQAVGQVYMGEVARLLREDPAKVSTLVKGTGRKLLRLGLIPIGLLAILGPWVFAKVFGGAWGESGQFVRLLAPMYLAQFAVVPMSQTLNLMQRQSQQFAWDLARLLVVVGSLVVPNALGLGPRVAIACYSAGMVAMYGLMLFLVLRAASRLSVATSPAPLESDPE